MPLSNEKHYSLPAIVPEAFPSLHPVQTMNYNRDEHIRPDNLITTETAYRLCTYTVLMHICGILQLHELFSCYK